MSNSLRQAESGVPLWLEPPEAGYRAPWRTVKRSHYWLLLEAAHWLLLAAMAAFLITARPALALCTGLVEVLLLVAQYYGVRRLRAAMAQRIFGELVAGLDLIGHGEIEAAEAYHQRLFERYGEAALAGLGQLRVAQGRLDEALALVSEVYRHGNPGVRTATAATLATLYALKCEPDLAGQALWVVPNSRVEYSSTCAFVFCCQGRYRDVLTLEPSRVRFDGKPGCTLAYLYAYAIHRLDCRSEMRESFDACVERLHKQPRAGFDQLVLHWPELRPFHESLPWPEDGVEVERRALLLQATEMLGAELPIARTAE